MASEPCYASSSAGSIVSVIDSIGEGVTWCNPLLTYECGPDAWSGTASISKIKKGEENLDLSVYG